MYVFVIFGFSKRMKVDKAVGGMVRMVRMVCMVWYGRFGGGNRNRNRLESSSKGPAVERTGI